MWFNLWFRLLCTTSFHTLSDFDQSIKKCCLSIVKNWRILISNTKTIQNAIVLQCNRRIDVCTNL